MAQRSTVQGFPLDNEDSFFKKACVHLMNSRVLLVTVVFMALPVVIVPYLSRQNSIQTTHVTEHQPRPEQVKGPLLVCQVSTDAFVRKLPWVYGLSHVPHDLCSHLVLTVVARPDFVSNVSSYDNFSGAAAPIHRAEILALRTDHPHLRILAGIGTMQNVTPLFDRAVLNRSESVAFAKNLLRWSLFHNLDGVLLGGLFPVKGRENGNRRVHLLKKIAAQFLHRELLLVIPPESHILKRPNAGVRLSQLVDLVILPPQWLAREKSLEILLSSGIPVKNLVVSVRFGGILYSLNSDKTPKVKDDAEGLIPYYGICKKRSWQRFHDGEVTLMNKGKLWLMVEDAESISTQVARLTKQGVAGIMAWDISTDDFTGYCGVKNYLLETIRYVIKTVLRDGKLTTWAR